MHMGLQILFDDNNQPFRSRSLLLVNSLNKLSADTHLRLDLSATKPVSEAEFYLELSPFETIPMYFTYGVTVCNNLGGNGNYRSSTDKT